MSPRRAQGAASDGTDACLVADIGGTNARFAIANFAPGDTPFELAHAGARRVGEFASLRDAIGDYLHGLGNGVAPRRAVLAVASPVTGDRIRFTNSHWNFSTDALRRELQFDALEVVNDFAAVAWALPALQRRDVEALGAAHLFDPGGAGMRAVVGPGTGLGIAGVRSDARQIVVLESEGGHASFAPRDDDEIYLWRFLRERYGRVSHERLLCGEGLVNLYQAWCARDAAPAPWRRAEQVSREARRGDEHARAATRSFCAAFGSFAGDAALLYGAWHGVYLSGAMLAHVFDDEGVRVFRERFEDKGRFAAQLRTVPTLRIVRDDVGNLGAAVYGARGSEPASA